MKIIRGLGGLSKVIRGGAATIGNFDGVHCGHAVLLNAMKDYSETHHVSSSVILFEPQPIEFFRPSDAPARITRLRDKINALAQFNVDQVVVLAFNRRMASMSADDFVHQVLSNGLGIRHLIVGDDFRFGAQRQGDYNFLRQCGEALKFTVAAASTFSDAGNRVSSTRIREALSVGDFKQAQRLLGRPYRISGRIAHGDKRGRQLGFPTANIAMHTSNLIMRGVFAVKVLNLADEAVYGVANMGVRPTVDGHKALLEVHLFDFDQTIYGQRIAVEFVEKIRDEQRFESLDVLKQQIENDATRAKQILAGSAQRGQAT